MGQSQSELFQLQIRFPERIENWSGVLNHVLGGKYERAYELARDVLGAKGDVDKESESRARLLAQVLDELYSNVVFHDMLGLSGEEREALMETRNLSEQQQARVRACAAAAAGLVGEFRLTRDTERIFIEVRLTRDFADFNDRWHTVRAEDYIPDFDKPSNRGILIIAGLCETGAYDSKSKTLRFTFPRKKKG